MKKSIVVLLFVFVCNMAFASKGEQSSVTKIEINNGWKFKQTDKDNWLPATVPGCVHTDLLNNKVIPDPFYRTNEKDLQWIDKVDWEYETEFVVDSTTFKKQNIELIFKGLDTYADVYLNDILILNADNMFREWKADIKKIINLGENNLKIIFNSPVKVDLPKLKNLGYPLPASNDQSQNGGLGDQQISIFARKAPYQYGWDWGPRFVTSGIWRPIYLRAWDSFVIENVHFVQNSLSKDLANILAHVEVNSSIDDNVNLKITFDGNEYVSKSVPLYKGNNIVSADFEIVNPEFWWPNGIGKPFLYNFISTLKSSSGFSDSYEQKIGLRTIEVVQEADSIGRSFYFKVNGVPVFMKGANYIPSDNFLNRVTDEDYLKIIKSAADANMNMLRVWGGGIYENDIFYDLCDKYGILVWQDFMFACSMYPGDQAFLDNVKQEAIDNVKRLRNHPSIAIWVGNNEIEEAWARWGWQQSYNAQQKKEIYDAYKAIFFNIIPGVIDEYDGSRFYWPSSPSADFGRPPSFKSGDFHYWGVWHGKEPFEKFHDHIGRFVSEYGFQSFPEFKTVKSYTIPEDWNIESEVMAAHQRSGIGNLRIRDYLNMYYKTPKDFESFLYVGQILQAYGIKQAIEAHRKAMPLCMGSLYWQIDDCWPVASWSSMDYYKRWKALQYYAKKAFEPVLITTGINKDSVDIYIVSDKLEDFPADLILTLYDFKGDVVYSNSIPVTVKKNSSNNYINIADKELFKGNDGSNLVLLAQLKSGDDIISSNKIFFVLPKDLSLQDPDIKTDIKKDGDDFTIEFSCDRFAKDVYINSDEVNGFFSDNYFDLIPGLTKKITFHPYNKIDDLDGKIKVISLIDSY